MRPARVTPTARQQEAIAWTWHGLTNKAIGRRLGVSESTAKDLLLYAYARLGYAHRPGARTRAAAWLWYQCQRRVARR